MRITKHKTSILLFNWETNYEATMNIQLETTLFKTKRLTVIKEQQTTDYCPHGLTLLGTSHWKTKERHGLQRLL